MSGDGFTRLMTPITRTRNKARPASGATPVAGQPFPNPCARKLAQVPPARTFPYEQYSNLGSLVDRRPLRSAEPGARVLPRDCGRDRGRRLGGSRRSGACAPRGWRGWAAAVPQAAHRSMTLDGSRLAGRSVATAIGKPLCGLSVLA